MGNIELYEKKHTESYRMQIHHHDYYQLLYVLAGEGEIALDGDVHRLGENDAALIYPSAKHAVSSPSSLTLLVLAFDGDTLDEPLAPIGQQPPFLTSFHLNLGPLYANEVRPLLRKLLFEQRQNAAHRDWSLRIHVNLVLNVICRAKTQERIHDANSLRADKIRAYLDGHYYENLTAETLGRTFGVTSRYLGDIFKKTYRLTPIQYLAGLRIGIARSLLETTDRNVVSICFEVGYESLPTFYRNFKSIVGISPSQYRKNSSEFENRPSN